MVRRNFILAFFLTLSLGYLFQKHTIQAGPLGASTVLPQTSDWGNNWRQIQVSYSSTTFVLISSTATGSGLGIDKWHYREISNCSTTGDLMLAPGSSTFGNFFSTGSIVLHSSDSFKVYGDAAVYGRWSPGTSSGGACGAEFYWK